MKHARKLAYQVDMEMEHSPTLVTVIGYIEKLGWKCERMDQAAGTLTDNNLLTFAMTHQAFAAPTKDGCFVFYKPGLTEKDLLFLLCHELYHILEGHTEDKNYFEESRDRFEAEANQFARCLTRMNPVKRSLFRFRCKISEHEFRKSAAIAALSTVLTLSVVTVVFGLGFPLGKSELPPVPETLSMPHSAAPAATAVPTAIPTALPKTVPASAAADGRIAYVAQYGEVYHIYRDCSYIREKTESVRSDLSVSEAMKLSRIKGMCSRCELRQARE